MIDMRSLIPLFVLGAVAIAVPHINMAAAQVDAGVMQTVPAVPSVSDPLFDIGRAAYKAVQTGNGKMAAALGLILLVAFLKWLAPKLHDKVGDWLQGDIGGSCLVLVGSVGGGLASAFAAGQAFSWSLMWTCMQVAIAASGGYAFLKKLVMPLWAKLTGK